MRPSSPDRTAQGDELAHEGGLRELKGFNDMTPPTPAVEDLDLLESAISEAEALVEPYIIGTKHVRVRVVTLRRVLSALRASQQVAKEQAEIIGELVGENNRLGDEVLGLNLRVSLAIDQIDREGHGWPAEIVRAALSRTRPSGGDADGEQSQ